MSVNYRQPVLMSTAVLKGTGVTYRQLDYWCRVNAIRPLDTIYGSGDNRRWTHYDQQRLKAIGATLKDVNALTMNGPRSGSIDLVRRIWDGLEHDNTLTIRQGAITITVNIEQDEG